MNRELVQTTQTSYTIPFYFEHNLRLVSMTSTERVVVRLTPDTIAVLDTLVQSGEFSSLSDVIMGAIKDFISKKFTAEEISKVLEELPNKKIIDPESLMESGTPTDMDAAVRAAVGNYVRNRMDGQR